MKKFYKEIGLALALTALTLGFLNGLRLSALLFPVIIVSLLIMIFKKQNIMLEKPSIAGLNSGKKGAIPQVTFQDIGGQEMAKGELQEALSFLKESEQAKNLGIRPLKGLLLTGPPGTGKTLLAKAAANFTGSVFLAASGSEFVQMYAGVGASRVRGLFKQARSLAEQAGKESAIIFIDEIDVLGAKRGQNQSHLEYDQTLNELLTQIDGVQSDHAVRVLVVGATNRDDLLDPALVRPGRFDRIVKVDLPDEQGRLHILKIHARKRRLSEDVNLSLVAKETQGFSGAHLESLLNEGAINALRNNRNEINREDLSQALEKVLLGEKASRSPSEDELKRVAYHELGHALVSEKVRPGSIASITISPRSNALGYIRQVPRENEFLITKGELLDAIQVCVAGSVAEELVLGERSTGAIGDIKQATDLCKRLIYAGLSPLGIVGDVVPESILHETISGLIQEEEKKVRTYLESALSLLEKLASILLEQETLSGEFFRGILKEDGGVF